MTKRLRHTLLLTLFMLACTQTVQAIGFSASEAKLKVAILYNLAKFIEWPSHRFQKRNSPVTLCIYAETPYIEAARRVANKPVQKSRVLAVEVVSHESDLSVCHIIFISKTTTAHLKKIPKQLLTSATLTVGETEDFIKYGGIINLIEINKKLRFEINLKKAESLSLKISSKLLRLAKEVY